MAAETTDQPCPDPSVHEKHNKLSEQASSAALYVTHPERNIASSHESRESPLGPDGKLSSKGVLLVSHAYVKAALLKQCAQVPPRH